MNIKTIINWKIFFILLLGSIISIVAIFPYLLSLEGDVINQIPLPLPIIFALTIIQNIILFSIAIFLGLLLSKKTGLGTRYLESYLQHKTLSFDIKNVFKRSIIFGVGIGCLIILLDVLFINIGIKVPENVSIPIWQGALASFYGGISEEILLRLFLMTFFIWIISKITKQKENSGIIWISIVVTALLFGILHLPAVSNLIELTPMIIFRTILLNFIGGIIFGFLYWKYGLESSMVSHFSTDIVLHVLFPIVLLLL